jgi:CRP-like cAMP-binding protein
MNEKADYKIIKASSLGEELTEQECRTLADIMNVRSLRDGETLVTEGQAEDTLYLLVDGRLAVIGKILGNDVTVYTMKEGECAGTRAFVDRTPRKATLHAVGKTIVYTLAPTTFESLIETHPHIMYKLMRALFRATHTNLLRMRDESQELVNYVTKMHGRY